MHQKKVLGVWMLTALVAGNMIGSGIFLLPPALAKFGSISIFGWVFTAIGAILLALVFAQLSHANPQVGGPYAYCREAFGDFIGFLVAYNYWIALWVGNAGIAVAFVSYFAVFVPFINSSQITSLGCTLSIVWILTLINIRGVREAGVVQLVMTVLKILPLVLVAVVGMFYVNSDILNSFNVSGKSNFSAISGVAALTLWSFIGVESATIPADDVENPRRDIPRGTIYGTLIAALVYLSSSVAVMAVLPNAQLVQSSAPFADAAKLMFGNVGYYLVAFGAMCSCFGALNGWIMLQGQIPLAAARDNLFPSSFKKESKNETPYFGLIVSAVLVSGLLLLKTSPSLVDQFEFMIKLATLATLIPYLLTTMAELCIFIKQPQALVGVNIKRSVLIACLAFLYSFWAIFGSGQEVVYYGVLLLFSGVPVYVWMKWRQSQVS